MPDIFFSYSRRNSDDVRALREHLLELDIWVDWEDIPKADPDWWQSIKDGIDSSDSIVFFVSPDSMESFVCNMELDYAIKIRKRIIPIILKEFDKDAILSVGDNYKPSAGEIKVFGYESVEKVYRQNVEKIGHINWLFIESADIDTFADQLITVAETNLEYVKQHTRYTLWAKEWKQFDESTDLLLFGEEITRAKQWLKQAEQYKYDEDDTSNPIPTDDQYTYIDTSSKAQIKRRRIVQSTGVTIAILALLIVGSLLVLVATSQEIEAVSQELNTLEQDIADRNAELNQLAIENISDVEIARAQCIAGILQDLTERQSVADLCNHMVDLAPALEKGFYRDFLGIANAQAGNRLEAVRDFEASQTHIDLYTENCESVIQRREQWITDLRDGNNPFLSNDAPFSVPAIQEWFNEPELDGNTCIT